MKSEKLLSLIGEIDEKFIEEAAMPYKRKPHYIRYGALAASFLFLILVAVAGFGRSMSKSSGFDGAFNGVGLAPETAYDEKYNTVADSAATTIASHDDAADENNIDYGYGFLAVISSIDTDKRIITVDFNEENKFFEDVIEIEYDTLHGAEPFENLKVNDEIEILVSVNDIAEINSIRIK